MQFSITSLKVLKSNLWCLKFFLRKFGFGQCERYYISLIPRLGGIQQCHLQRCILKKEIFSGVFGYLRLCQTPNYFRKKLTSWMFGKVLSRTLNCNCYCNINGPFFSVLSHVNKFYRIPRYVDVNILIVSWHSCVSILSIVLLLHVFINNGNLFKNVAVECDEICKHYGMNWTCNFFLGFSRP